MPRHRKLVPTYRRHKQSNRGIVTVYEPDGRRRDVLLPGRYGSQESRRAYAKLCERIAAEPIPQAVVIVAKSSAADIIDDLILQHWEHAKIRYRGPDGKPTSELSVYRGAVLELRKLYGDLPIAEFDLQKLEAVRDAMISGTFRLKGPLCRNVVNKFIGRIRAIFRWGKKRKLVPIEIIHDLADLDPLERNRTLARETEPVQSIADTHVEATLPYVGPVVRGMIELQRLTGMRPGEVCGISMSQIDASGDVWVYDCKRHKTSWRGKHRRIAIGPKGQAVIRRFMTTHLTAPLFQSGNDKAYNKDSYNRAINRGIRKANADREKEAGHPLKPHELIPSWSPNQLRHSAATAIDKKYGRGVAQRTLGHGDAATTQVYIDADRDLAIAIDAMRQIG